MSPSDFPGSPRLLKGALVIFETRVPVPTNLIVFQYNPEKLTRSLTPEEAETEPGTTVPKPRPVVPPKESFRATIELDAADYLEVNDPLAFATGLHPTLAALELLLYPPSTEVILKKALALVGSSAISPAHGPMVLFVWGAPRVVPVRVKAVEITEDLFDPLLNPIRATVELELEMLSEADLKAAGPPFDTLALVHHISKEALARLNVVNSLQQVGGMLPF